MKGKIGWRSPSNIALIKYWGKKQNQIPCNASLSLGLSSCYTDTFIEFEASVNPKFEFHFGEKKEKNEDFEIKVKTYLDKLSDQLSFINHLYKDIF